MQLSAVTFSALLVLPLLPAAVQARPSSWEEAQAFVCVTTAKCLLPYSDPQVRWTHEQLATLEKHCRKRGGAGAMGDKVWHALAKLESTGAPETDPMAALRDFASLAKEKCASRSIDAMLKQYVSRRNRGASHADVLAELRSAK